MTDALVLLHSHLLRVRSRRCDSTPRPQLRENHRRHDRRAAQELNRRQAFTQQDVSSQGSKDRFQAKYECRIRRWSVPLSPDLERVSKSERHNGRVQNRSVTKSSGRGNTKRLDESARQPVQRTRDHHLPRRKGHGIISRRVLAQAAQREAPRILPRQAPAGRPRRT